ncbi:TonB family protein [Pedobacter sp. MW01-1-1]|uniref:TonB family protein n=1 Tax=Pedobacter sp. MW01-1-1 TaxID=3383027 RepID=UPI003FF078AA
MSYAHYLLQVNIYLVVFYAFYKWLLAKETYFVLNRFYLVLAGGLSLVIPFIRLEWLLNREATKQVYSTVSWEMVLDKTTQISNQTDRFSMGQLVTYIYLAGVVFCVGRLIYNFIQIKRSIKLAKSGAAFVFFKKKIIDADLPQHRVVDMHEQAHIKQWHTIDVLFFEILGIIVWINPVIYLFKRDVKNIHEYLADEMAADFQGDKAEYALLLLSKSFGVSPNTLATGFFKKSLIKKRIYMLHRERSKKTAVLKYGIAIPLLAIFVVLSSATVRKNEELIQLSEQIPMDKSINRVMDMIEEPNNQLSKAVLDEASHAVDESAKRTEQVLVSPRIKKSRDAEVKKLDEDLQVHDFTSLDKAPEYPGGVANLYKFLGSNIKYPELAQRNKVQGKVFLSFLVEKDGRLDDIKVIKGLGSGLDEEALRVLKESPKWNPGSVNGQPVRVRYHINVNFSLNNEEASFSRIRIRGKVKEPEQTYLSDGRVDASNAPLYFVNGVKVEEPLAINNLNPNDISSISVLKDNSATVLYGPEAKNGVILISTKAK